MQQSEELFRDALCLPDRERGDLALRLLDSLSLFEQDDDPAERETWWMETLPRRAARALTPDADRDPTVDDAVARIASELDL